MTETLHKQTKTKDSSRENATKWLYLHRSTSLSAKFPLWTCPAQTHQSKGQLKGGRSSVIQWLFES